MSGYDATGYSLISAIRRGKVERVRTVLNSSGLSNPPQWTYWYILLRDVIKKNNIEIAKLLLSKNIIVDFTFSKQSLLHLAIENGDLELVELLIEKKADMMNRNRIGDTPLHTAIKNGRSKISEILLERKVAVNLKNNCYLTPLHIASKEGHLDIVEQLLNRGASINSTGINQETPLHLAIGNNRTEIVKLLLENSSDVNAMYTHITDPDLEISTSGFTPLHLACDQGNQEIVKLLLNKGAKLNVKDKDHYLPIWYAIHSGYKKLIKVILEHQIITDYVGNIEVMLRDAVKNGDLVTVVFTLKNYTQFKKLVNPKTYNIVKYNPADLVDEFGQSLLHLSTQYGYFDIVKALLRFGANINALDSLGRTPLHIACQERFGPVIEILLRHAPNLDVPCDEGYLPINYLHSSKLYSQRFNRHLNYDNDPDCIVANSTELNELFICHIIKLRAANLSVSKINLQLIKNDIKFDEIKNEFKTEIEKLKTEKICRNLHFYDILIKNIDQLTSYTKNRTVFKTLMSNKCLSKFPHYGIIIKTKFKKSIVRKQLLDEGIKVLSMFYSKISILCIEKILMFLSNNDLKILIDDEENNI